MFSLNFKEHLPPRVAEEFESLISQMSGFFGVSFNEDGTLIGVDTSLLTVKIGTIVQFAGPTAPVGWLMCDGSAVSRVTYKSLFEVIGTTYGAGDGSTTFNLPDLRQRFPLGKASSGTGAALGATGGAIDHVHAGGSHTHSIAAAGAHSHTVASHSHTIADDDTTTSQPDPFTVVEVAEDLSGSVFVSRSTHVHTLNNHDHGGTTGSSAPATDAQPDHDHSGSTGSASGTTGANNPPFLSVNYIVLAGA